MPETGVRHPGRVDDDAAHAPSRGWGTYLIAAAAMVPIMVPSGPVQLAFVDGINLVALALFAGLALTRGLAIQAPLAWPFLLVALGSLLAMTSAISVPVGFLALVQDLYLFLWFVMLTTLMVRRGDLKAVRITWLWAANLVAVYCIVLAVTHGGGISAGLLGLRGFRPAATFYNPNMLADYLMLSVFIALGLEGKTSWRLLVPSLVLLVGALVLTKSNGGLISITAGLAVWMIARAMARRVAVQRVAGVAALLLAVGVLGAWGLMASGAGGALVRHLETHSFMGRAGHSLESRQAIWEQLQRSYQRSPIGIGPGNSAEQILPIGERERPDSFRSKESHNDYLAYAIERGPLGLIGLLLAVAMVFLMVLRGRGRIALREPSAAAAAALWASLLGALVGAAVHSAVLERLHFRHFWLFMAIVCALVARVPASSRLVRPRSIVERGGSRLPVPRVSQPTPAVLRRA
ncbi:MAG TPA: O-antigen ligase family protein [Candidatus Eisenbacteria bacterium]|nr:O-antigen ligase family protein [Candidatus Eisenbacteria bacterium]